MVEDQYSYRSVYQSLIDRGVHKLGVSSKYAMVVIVHLFVGVCLRTILRGPLSGFQNIGRAPRTLWSGKEGSCTARP